MTLKVAINGFGRIGRTIMRAAKESGADIDFVAVNDLGDHTSMAHLLKHDTVFGPAPFDVEIHGEDEIVVDGDEMRFLSERDPSALPWNELGVDLVFEATGIFKKREQAAMHLEAGAGRVIISAPSPDADAMIVLGVNDHELSADHVIVSNASCTTNCFSPMAKVLDDAFGIDQGLITTIHAYTGTQNLVDAPHKDLRRARAAAVNLIPTSTGAAKATGRVLDHLMGKLDGLAVRVPVPAGSATDFVGVVRTEVSVDDVNEAFRVAAAGPMSGILAFSDEPLVSSDIVGRPESCIYDSGMTMTMPAAGGGSMVKVIGWYDNEWGYSNRMVDLAMKMGAL